MAAPSVILDPTGLNISLNAQGSATGIMLQEANEIATTGLDWGGQAIQDIINTGQYLPEDIDGVLAAGGVYRTIVLPVRIIGSSKDNLNLQISNLNYAFAKASRYQTLDLVVTPAHSSAATTFKVIGGDFLSYYTNVEDTQNRAIAQLQIFTLPFGYGAKQTYGSTGSPLLAAAATPATFTVTIPSGSEGDVLADVTIVFDVTVDGVQAVTLAAISGNSTWTGFSAISGWSNGSGAGTRATQTLARYSSGSAPSYVCSASGAGQEAYTQTFANSDFPAGTAIRCILTADDFQVAASARGLCQLRLQATSGSVTQYGDWVSVPAAAGNGTSTHFLQGLDMGVFTFPPGPTGSQAFSGTTTLGIHQMDGNPSRLAMAFDQMIFLPDNCSIIAEWPVAAQGPAANVAIRCENDILYTNANGNPQANLMSGAHIRSRGTTQYSIWASDQPLAGAANVTYSLAKAWCEYTPRYVSLAPV